MNVQLKEDRNMARFVLLYLKTHGMKSLERDIELQFYKKDIKDLEYGKAFVKAIYGTNGEGKSAIAHTLELYRNTVTNPDYLSAQNMGGYLKSLINKHTQCVCVDLYFAMVFDKETMRIYRHIIDYVLKDGRLVISHEAIRLCKGTTWGNPDKEVTLVETNNGEITKFFKKDPIESEVKRRTMNLLTGSSAALSIFNTLVEANVKFDKNDENASFFVSFIPVICFALLMVVFIDKDDRYVMDKEYYDSITEKMKGTLLPSFLPLVGDSNDEIDESDKKVYEKEIHKVEQLLKVFKPELKKIEIFPISKRGTKVTYKKSLVYNNGDVVELEYESTGIKKLFRLFTYLSVVDNGGVVFIDEFDANIHDVYLCKLVEYFTEYTNGQLIFTTHNLGPMEVLDKADKKYSIDFINNQSVASWRKNGNYSVVKVYRNGMIPNSPFNIDAVDFAKVFGGSKKNGK